MKWRVVDGGDYITGSEARGGMVFWKTRGRYVAAAYFKPKGAPQLEMRDALFTAKKVREKSFRCTRCGKQHFSGQWVRTAQAHKVAIELAKKHVEKWLKAQYKKG